MLQTPCMGPIIRGTLMCRFDLCRVGNLLEPVIKKPLRKRLNVFTTSLPLKDSLHKRFCKGNHEHQVIAGTTQKGTLSMPLTQYTEKYPRKFARQVIQILKRKTEPIMHALAAELEEHPTKRRRLDQKSSNSRITMRNPDVTWQEVLQEADKLAPRVGVKVIEHGELLHGVQRLCPTHKIKHVVLCRGTDRLMGPSKKLHPREAPFRKMVGLRRRFETVFVEDEWEQWERLSYRKLTRLALLHELVWPSLQVPELEQGAIHRQLKSLHEIRSRRTWKSLCQKN